MKDNQNRPAEESAGAAVQTQTSPPHRILVVDDETDIRHFNTAVLLRSGYEVEAVADGAAAWEALNADSYDLLITDNSMPRVTGIELLKMLRAARMELPVIMATGALPTEEFARYPWLQPAALLLKPYTTAMLLSAVEKVLRDAYSTTGDPSPCPTISPHRVLVVDEDRDLRRLYAETLAGPGCDVDVVEDGATGWEALQAKPYNLLITEHDLPKLTGVELVRKLRAAHMDLPVVMAAGRMPTDELAQNPSLQLAATLAKPFAVDALLDTVRTILRATESPVEQTAPLANGQGSPAAVDFQL